LPSPQPQSSEEYCTALCQPTTSNDLLYGNCTNIECSGRFSLKLYHSATGRDYSTCRCPLGEYVQLDGRSCASSCPTTYVKLTYNMSCYSSTNCISKGFTKTSDTCSCKLGKYITLGSYSCTSCPAGKYNDVVDATSCKECLTFNNNSISSAGSSTCTLCIDGFEAASNKCTCKVGRFINASSVCEECPLNSFSAATNSTSCTPCG
jgi:hypothetical protein